MTGSDRLWMLYCASFAGVMAHAPPLLAMLAMLTFMGLYLWFDRTRRLTGD